MASVNLQTTGIKILVDYVIDLKFGQSIYWDLGDQQNLNCIIILTCGLIEYETLFRKKLVRKLYWWVIPSMVRFVYALQLIIPKFLQAWYC